MCRGTLAREVVRNLRYEDHQRDQPTAYKHGLRILKAISFSIKERISVFHSVGLLPPLHVQLSRSCTSIDKLCLLSKIAVYGCRYSALLLGDVYPKRPYREKRVVLLWRWGK